MRRSDPWLELTTHLGAERESSVWGSTSDVLLELDAAARGLPERAKLRSFAIAQLRPGLALVGWDARANEPPRDTLTREVLLAALSRLGDAQVRAEARKRYDAVGDDPTKLGPLATVILDAVARNADAATFDRLLASARTAPSFLDAQLVFDALASVEDPALVKKLLDTTLTDAVPMGLRRRIILRVAEQGDHGVLAWDFSNEMSGTRRWASIRVAVGHGRRASRAACSNLIARPRCARLRKRTWHATRSPNSNAPPKRSGCASTGVRGLVPAVVSWIEAHAKT